MNTSVMLLSDYLRDGAEVNLSSGDDRDVQDLRHYCEPASVMCHCVEPEYVLCKSFLYVALKEDGVLLSKSGDSLCH